MRTEEARVNSGVTWGRDTIVSETRRKNKQMNTPENDDGQRIRVSSVRISFIMNKERIGNKNA